MKKCRLLVSFFIVLMLSGCSSDVEPVSRMMNLRLISEDYYHSCGETTRAEDASLEEFETEIHDFVVALFNSDGVLLKSFSGNNSDLISFELSELDFRRLESVVVFCNLQAVDLSSSLSFEVGKTTLKDLKNIRFKLSDKASIESVGLPMTGTCNIGSEAGSSGNIAVRLKRSVAKIEVVDELPEGYEINRVTLCEGSEWGNLISDEETNDFEGGDEKMETVEFIKGEEKSFQLYLPSAKLPDDLESKGRQLQLELSDGTGNTIERVVYIAPYENGSVLSPDKWSAPWTHLKSNHHYKFHVSDIEVKSEIKDKIRIHWYACLRENSEIDVDSKFSTYRIDIYNIQEGDYYANVIANLSSQKYNDENHYDGDVYILEYDLDLSKKSWNFNDLDYILYSAKSDSYYSQGSLAADAVKIENEGDVTHVWLNDHPLDGTLGGEKYYPTELPYRIYCRGDKLTKVWVRKNGGSTNFEGREIGLSTDSRGYRFIEFEMVENHLMTLKDNFFEFYIFNDKNKEINSGTAPNPKVKYFSAASIFRQRIDGKEYYVFYYN